MVLDLLAQFGKLACEAALFVHLLELVEELVDVDMLLERLLDAVADLREKAEGRIEGRLLGLLVNPELALQLLEQRVPLLGIVRGLDAVEELARAPVICPQQRIDVHVTASLSRPHHNAGRAARFRSRYRWPCRRY